MNIFSRTGIFFLISAVALSCSKTPAQETEEPVKPKNSYVESMYVNGQLVNAGGTVSGVDPADITLKIVFSNEIDMSELSLGGISMSNGIGSDFTVMDSGDPYTLELHLNRELKYFSSYYLYVSEGENLGLNIIDTYDYTINTEIDPTPKFEEIPDEDLMTLVQKQTFSYFWDYAHPDSGLARERLNSGNTVTSGGSGFGIMTIPVAVSRGFISREEAVERMLKIVTFLDETAETFHGAFIGSMVRQAKSFLSAAMITVRTSWRQPSLSRVCLRSRNFLTVRPGMNSLSGKRLHPSGREWSGPGSGKTERTGFTGTGLRTRTGL